MSKREARSFAAAGVDVDAPRAKRRKEAPATSSTSPEGKHDAEAHTPTGTAAGDLESAGLVAEDNEEVREKGLQLWQTLKDAVNKEGQIASFPFMRLPSKRQYPDYYVQIKRPIALDDIKTRLESREYPTFDAVRQDLETCFRNAKRYNMKESQIFKDAKFLHKLLTKEYNRISGKEEDNQDGDGSNDEKKKAPNLSRLLKTKLQKLVDKTDDNGRVLSTEFMELPNRKQWPMYYTIIKKPQSLENVFKKLKRKEYHRPFDFANDVELVFSNALEFNQEHTQIWEDASSLRDHFRKLMSDLPEPFSIPAYVNASEHPTKIKLKMPQTPAPANPTAAPAPSLPSTNSIVVGRSHASSSNLRTQLKQDVKASSSLRNSGNVVKSPPVIPPTPNTPSLHAPVSQAATPAVRLSALSPASSLPDLPQAPKPGLTQPPNGGGIYVPHPGYQQPSLVTAPPKAPTKSPAIVNTDALTVSPPVAAASLRSSSAVTQYAPALKHVVITTMPACRRLVLDHSDGVRTWAMRLDKPETRVIVSDVVGAHDSGEPESGEDAPLPQEEEEEEDDNAEPSSHSKRKNAAVRKRTRSTLTAKKAKGKASDSQFGPIQVKLNGVLLNVTDDSTWETPISSGLNVLEVGEKGGLVWRVYLEKPAF